MTSCASSAFSLLELLVVMAIMVMLFALVVPAFRSIGDSNRLTSATQMLIAELNRARQEAIAKNRAVEVRFYTTAPKDLPADVASKAVRAVRGITLEGLDEQALISATNSKAGRLAVLPMGIKISNDTKLSSAVLSGSGTETLPSFGASQYAAFRFRPDGRTDLTDNVFWTLLGDNAQGDPPPNFATVQLDARTGRVRLFRP